MLVKKLHPNAVIPKRATSGSAAYDICTLEDTLIIPDQTEIISTGIAVAIPKGWVGILSLRSGIGFKLDSLSHIGIIDSDYRGEIKVKFFNFGTDGVYLKSGDRFAQLTLVPHYAGATIVTDELPPAEEDHGGFGSTGK